MCGFIVSNSPNLKESNLAVIKKRIQFRGPDGDSDLVNFAGWNLYHARLAIIAPNDKYNQPYITSDGGILVFNGEILNYKELAKKNNIINKDSDTHVLSELLQIKGFNLNQLEGFFAFVLIDKNGTLKFCTRDRFGVKPLNYYIDDNKHITISSEASVISDLFNLDYNEKSLNEYKVFRAPIYQQSFFKKVKVVGPGSCLINGTYFDSTNYITESYLPFTKVLEKLDTSITNSIESRMISDVPVALLYSGGIDSNLINEYTNSSLTRFTGGFVGDYDVKYANEGSSFSNIITVSNSEFIERFESMINLRKEPLSVPNEVILSFLAESWSEIGGKVLLSGEAADEFFAGYDKIYYWALEKDLFDVREFLDLYAYVKIEEISEDIVDETQDFFNALGEMSVFEMVRQFFIKIHLPVLFRRLDFALMYSGVEGREPLASYEMFKVAMRINPKHLFKESLGKYPLRLIISKYLGDNFAYTPKVGFPIDLGKIFDSKNIPSRYENYNVWCNENLRIIKQ
jgi:asparagine synthase (glutamine-hydrolysing)